MSLEKNSIGIKELVTSYVKIEGTAVFKITDTYPKNIVIVSVEPNIPFYLEGWCDLSDLHDGEEIKLSEYTKFKLGGSWRRYEVIAYLNAQPNPAYHIMPLLSFYGLGIILTMPVAPDADRNFDYLFFAWQAF